MWNSIFTVTPINSETNKWLERNISTRSIITKNGFLISHHFIEDILESLYDHTTTSLAETPDDNFEKK